MLAVGEHVRHAHCRRGKESRGRVQSLCFHCTRLEGADAAPQKLRVSRICVEDIVSAQIDACDPLKTLPAADFCHVLSEVTDIVVRVMTEGERAVRAGPRRC